MPKNSIVLLLLLWANNLSAQGYAGKWEGDGYYAPGQPITTIMKKMAGRKKLSLEFTADGGIAGTLLVTYDKSKATIVNESADQVFTVAGKLDLNRQLLLLIVTHTKPNANTADAGIPFQKPDSIYYSIELLVRDNKNILSAGVNRKLNQNSNAEWVGSSKGNGMGMNISDNVSMHMLPLHLILENTYKAPPASVVNKGATEASITASSTAKQKPPANAPASTGPVTTRIPSAPGIPRKKVIQRTIELDTGLVKLDLYDNGEVDGDIATLLLDGKPIIENQLLSTKAATVSINLLKQPGDHILELFAINLGSIPPNSALVVLTCNKKRYEIFLSSNDTENGSVKLVLK
jgi:hypothetical protein